MLYWSYVRSELEVNFYHMVIKSKWRELCESKQTTEVIWAEGCSACSCSWGRPQSQTASQQNHQWTGSSSSSPPTLPGESPECYMNLLLELLCLWSTHLAMERLWLCLAWRPVKKAGGFSSGGLEVTWYSRVLHYGIDIHLVLDILHKVLKHKCGYSVLSKLCYRLPWVWVYKLYFHHPLHLAQWPPLPGCPPLFPSSAPCNFWH